MRPSNGSSEKSAPEAKPQPWELAYDRRALDNLKALPQKQRRQVQKRIDALAANPHPVNSKKMFNMSKGGDAVYREESGDYRILYAVREGKRQLLILDADDRKRIYRNK